MDATLPAAGTPAAAPATARAGTPALAPAPPSVPATSTPASAGGLVPGWIGAQAHDAFGDRVGRVADVLFDAHTRAPAWLMLALPRTNERFVLVPTREMRHSAAGVHLAWTGDVIRCTPPILAPPGGLVREQALDLARHFGVRCGAGPWHGVVEPQVQGAPERRRITG